jgi:hypothetical protein
MRQTTFAVRVLLTCAVTAGSGLLVASTAAVGPSPENDRSSTSPT